MSSIVSRRALSSAVLLLALAGCAGAPNKESFGEYIDDSAITTKVKAAVFNEPTLKVAQINVETFKGTVQLSGFVKAPEDVMVAEEATRRVNGVKMIKNDLVVR